MPGPVRRRGQHLLDAYKKGLFDESFLNDSVSRLLGLLERTGKSKILDWKEGKEKATDLPAHRAILRKAGAEGG